MRGGRGWLPPFGRHVGRSGASRPSRGRPWQSARRSAVGPPSSFPTRFPQGIVDTMSMMPLGRSRRTQLKAIHRSAWKECSKKVPCENKGKANEEEAHAPGTRGGDRLGRLHRPQPADGGEGKVRRLRREAARASGERVLRGRGDGGVGWHGRRPGPERDGGLRGLPPILITRGLRTSALRTSKKFAAKSSHLADVPFTSCLLPS